MLDVTVRDVFPFPIVGVGASAADAKDLEHFFSRTAADSGAAFIVIQPQAPDQEAITAEFLSRHTTMPVTLMGDGVKLEPNHVYIMRPVRRELDSLRASR